ncbi:hypothetical protein M493_02845 [Geobacillus genomosp. 3]|uniref:Uncharacterized protein n=1 Tax=Geobacillus genomosp. 3 TaxID=1921421 RepID=S5Z1R0_GEOG3|nr:hypothetical protein M493_02845 [Geobacillus genomosp. 3]
MFVVLSKRLLYYSTFIICCQHFFIHLAPQPLSIAAAI